MAAQHFTEKFEFERGTVLLQVVVIDLDDVELLYLNSVGCLVWARAGDTYGQQDYISQTKKEERSRMTPDSP